MHLRKTHSIILICLGILLILPQSVFGKNLKPVKDVETENEVIKLYNHALKYSKAERNVHARVLLEKAATYDPTSVSPYIHAALSEIYHDLGNPERAISEAKLSLRFDDSQKGLYYNLGLYCKDASRYEEGIQFLTTYSKMVSGEKRINALSLIENLKVEQTKMGSFTNNDPDYLGQLMAENAAHRWARDRIPLKVFIQPDSDAKGFNPESPSIARNAFITWYQASGKKLSFDFVANEADSDINVEWTDGVLKVGDEKYERTKAGLTTTRRREDNIEHARIQVRTVRAFTKEPETTERIKETCLHEIGHALGLNGHSMNTADIMYFGNTSRQLPALTKRDKATMARLYQAYPRYPMVGVDTSFPYPPPDTSIPRLTGSGSDDNTAMQNNGDTTGSSAGGNVVYSGNYNSTGKSASLDLGGIGGTTSGGMPGSAPVASSPTDNAPPVYNNNYSPPPAFPNNAAPAFPNNAGPPATPPPQANAYQTPGQWHPQTPATWLAPPAGAQYWPQQGAPQGTYAPPPVQQGWHPPVGSMPPPTMAPPGWHPGMQPVQTAPYYQQQQMAPPVYQQAPPQWPAVNGNAPYYHPAQTYPPMQTVPQQQPYYAPRQQ